MSSQSVECPYCGAPNEPVARFCAECGGQLPETAENTAPRPSTRRTTPRIVRGEATHLSDTPPSQSAQPAPQPDYPSAQQGQQEGYEGHEHTAGQRTATQCEMIIGFLIPHRCDNIALGRCSQCGKSFCDEHLSVTEHGMMCVACEQGFEQPYAMDPSASHYDSSDIMLFYAATTWSDDDDRWDMEDDTFSDLS